MAEPKIHPWNIDILKLHNNNKLKKLSMCTKNLRHKRDSLDLFLHILLAFFQLLKKIRKVKFTSVFNIKTGLS